MSSAHGQGRVVGGRYELIERLGQGGMGTVYRARDQRLLREVAVKVLQEDANDADTGQFYFHREARAIAALESPHIIPIHDYSGPDESPAFIVMSLVRGMTLERMVSDQDGRLIPEAVVMSVGYGIAAALAHAHENGVVHRDVKPANVLLDGSGRTLLTDFGLAKAFRDPSKLGKTVAGKQTTLMGTPEFLAPEQVTGAVIGPDVDVFCLGAVLYYVATGASPFKGQDTIDCMRRIAAVNFAPLTQHRQDLSDAFQELVGQCLQLDPLYRPTPTEVMTTCHRLLEEIGRADATANVRAFLAGELVSATGSSTSQTAALSRLDGEGEGVVVEQRDGAWGLTGDEGGTQGLQQAGELRPSQTTDITPFEQAEAMVRQAVVRRWASWRVLVPAVVGVVLTALALAWALRPRSATQPAVLVPVPVVTEQAHSAPPPRVTTPATESPSAIVPEIAVTPAPTAAAQPTAPPPPEPASAPATRRVERAPHGRREKSVIADAEPPTDAVVTSASVDIVVEPWGTVYVDGRRIGDTPFVRTLTAMTGDHRVRVVHPQLGSQERVVSFGKSTRVVFALGE